jgi:hypothetical protein
MSPPPTPFLLCMTMQQMIIGLRMIFIPHKGLQDKLVAKYILLLLLHLANLLLTFLIRQAMMSLMIGYLIEMSISQSSLRTKAQDHQNAMLVILVNQPIAVPTVLHIPSFVNHVFLVLTPIHHSI